MAAATVATTTTRIRYRWYDTVHDATSIRYDTVKVSYMDRKNLSRNKGLPLSKKLTKTCYLNHVAPVSLLP
uniref:Uncharacterized protein n=1 Tax=Oryza brachyantha TaxID=4533 RepID=J3LW06_ORYBR